MRYPGVYPAGILPLILYVFSIHPRFSANARERMEKHGVLSVQCVLLVLNASVSARLLSKYNASILQLCCAYFDQVCLEGQISKDSIQAAMSRGQRASGDLIPWTLAQQVLNLKRSWTHGSFLRK